MEQLLIVEDDIGLNQGLCKALKADDRQIISCHDRSNKLGIKEKISRGKFPRLIFFVPCTDRSAP